MRAAFKEWAIVVDALGNGDQILILRKGGISEGRGGFQVETPNFWLFPTAFHQQRESVVPAAQARYDSIAHTIPGPGKLMIEFAAHVEDWRQLNSLAMAEKLRGLHIWKDEVIAQRFEWGCEKNIFALAVRVFRLPHPVELPMVPSYGGCKSWINLEVDVPENELSPVLGENEFQNRLDAYRGALDPVATAAA